ncbi:ferric reductase NAD binding domain-containing protein [Rhizoctonia solani AG-1 IA]|uniref:Ferric reductase NAD binding domain-containing protein n=1 Tax=Thanatephorus cucumeris (strain AG1-IA) TaxID=983506 RepID=L8WZA4_THACA|nr:ferric reductase NAD binding domain-containing protein [Rhizoctonia solani AG-1 IA]
MASSGPPSGAQSGITSDDLVFYIDMALVGILGVATLVYLPRTIARYAHKSGRTEGWLLLQGKQSNQYPRKQAASKSEASVREKEPTSPRTTHQYPPNQPNLGDLSAPTISSTMHAGSTTTIRARLLASNKGRQLGAPPAHIPSLRSFVPLAGKFLDYHIAGYSIRQLTILSVYLAIICIAMFYQSNPKTNTNRAGFVVMSQMPVAFALGTKNSVITILTGISYEQMWKHQPEVAPPYVATCIVIYAADQVTRLVKTRVRKAILTPVPELGSTHVYVPRLDKGWVAGQHVRIRVLSFGVGLFGWAECHPFTIANSSSDAPEGLTLVCKRAGDWTSALYRMANNKSNSEEHRSAYVLIEGGAGNTLFASFSGVMLVLGGSGITFGTSVLEDIIAKKASGAARAMCINFVWAIQHPCESAAADPYLSTFVEIVQRAADIPDLRLSVSVFYTRGADNAYSLKTRLPPNVQIKSGRPDLLEELSSVLDRTQHAISMHQSPKNGVILAACGPDQLISSVYAAKSGAPSEAQRSVGGLELHTDFVQNLWVVEHIDCRH